MSTSELGRISDHHTTMKMVINQTSWWTNFAIGCLGVTAVTETACHISGLHGIYTPVGRTVGAIRMTSLSGIGLALIGVYSSLTDMHYVHSLSSAYVDRCRYYKNK